MLASGFLVCAIAQVLMLFLPWGIRRILLQSLFGHQIHATAKIGYSLVHAERAKLGFRAEIGSFTIVRNLQDLVMDEHSMIGSFNWISGGRLPEEEYFRDGVERRRSLILGRHAAITNRHRIDATDLVSIGAFTTIAGHGSNILTHGIDILDSRQTCDPVVIGEYCLIGTGVTILKGVEIEDCVVVGAGSVVVGHLTEKYTLYGGVPAKPIKQLPLDAGYFRRTQGVVT